MATATKTKPSKNGAPKKERPKKLKQQYIEGLEPPSNPKLDALAEQYVEARSERMEMLREEIKRRDLLHAAMKEAELPYYENSEYRVEFSLTEKVKVKRRGSDEADDE